MVETLLDAAYAAMQAEDADDEARRRFYERLTGTELFLLLDAEPVDDKISPHVFDLSDHSFVLVFDQEHRLSQFTGITSPYAALSGRVICQMLAPQGLGMGFNLDVAPSSILLPPEAVQWLAEMDATPEEITAKVQAFAAPTGLPEAFLQILILVLPPPKAWPTWHTWCRQPTKTARRATCWASSMAVRARKRHWRIRSRRRWLFSGLEAGIHSTWGSLRQVTRLPPVLPVAGCGSICRRRRSRPGRPRDQTRISRRSCGDFLRLTH